MYKSLGAEIIIDFHFIHSHLAGAIVLRLHHNHRQNLRVAANFNEDIAVAAHVVTVNVGGIARWKRSKGVETVVYAPVGLKIDSHRGFVAREIRRFYPKGLGVC